MESAPTLFEPLVHAPDLCAAGGAGAPWFNSAPLPAASLRGQVVCVDFWDYTCVNCIRTLPSMRAWHERYAHVGLVIIGVHAPEFQFAHQTTNVERGIREFGLSYPIVLDNDYAIWRAFANQYWPAKYLIDAQGYIRYTHFGEGAYQETEHAMQQLLRLRNPAVVLPALLPPVRESEMRGAVCFRVTPELYLGYRRGRIGNEHGFAPEMVREFSMPTERQAECFYAGGRWFSGPESLRFEGPCDGQAAGMIALRYTAKEVNLVMRPETGHAHQVQLWSQGEPLPRSEWGGDVQGPDAAPTIVVDCARMYALTNHAGVGEHELELRVTQPGLGCYAFTFVSCVSGR